MHPVDTPISCDPLLVTRWWVGFIAFFFNGRQEELKYQGEVRDEMASLETSLAQVKRDYEILKIEHEQTMAANEQAAPIAR